MTASDDLLARIEADRGIADLLAWPADFDIDRRDPVEELRLPTGVPLCPIAGSGTGGTYFLCGGEAVLYADSEGSAALIGADLAEAVEMLVVCPYWRDLGGSWPVEELEQEYREDLPDYDERRDRLISALGLTPPPVAEIVARLRATAARTEPEFVPTAVEREDGEVPLPYRVIGL
jgi:hypothetical protein